MRIHSCWIRFGAATCLLWLSACGGGGGDDASESTAPPAQAGVGPAGGTVTGPNGTKVVIPPGALANIVDIRIEQNSANSPALPGTFSASGPMFAITPHGTTFAVPVTVTLPFDPATVVSGSSPVLYKTNAQDQWESIDSAVFGADSVTAQITSLSFFQPLSPPVVRGAPHRSWLMFVEEPEEVLGSDIQIEGPLHEIKTFGPNTFDIDGDGEQTMEVFSSADGVTYWVSTEDRGHVSLVQKQSFIKTATGATLQFVITAATLEAIDANLLPTSDECPRGPALEVCTPIYAHLRYHARALDTLGRPMFDENGLLLFDTKGFAKLEGRVDAWSFDLDDRSVTASTRAWSSAQFTFTKFAEGSPLPIHPKLELREPIIIDVDLTSVGVNEEFFIETSLDVYARSRGRESAMGAYLRDPAKIGGAQMVFAGLEPGTAQPPSNAPIGVAPPIPCSTDTDPAAGILQFSAPSYTMVEAPFVGLSGLEITRTQGSTGAVSATITIDGGTATPEVHYTPVAVTVRFEDGDTTTRTVSLDVIPDDEAQPDRTIELTLSEPGGCVSLGPLSTSLLTILDDDRPPAPAQPSGLDLSFGNEGLSASEAFGGDRSAMALQSDGKIVMVGGTFTDFILARFDSSGALDASFDGDGRVTTDMVAGEQEEALGIAIQTDGKIVVVGYTGVAGSAQGTNFALARFNSNGSLDTAFGTGGQVVSGVAGIAHAVAIQADGRIIVTGDVAKDSGTDFSDFVVARYNSNGSLDTSFGSGGQIVTDIGAGTNTARNIVLQLDGAIVVSGEPIGSFTGSNRTDVVRYEANGALDPSFGTGGKVTLNNTRVGEGLALQNDGKFVLAGTIDVTAPPALPGSATQFAVARLNANGSRDETFGTVSTPISGERDSAHAVALQSDGKIIVAGRSSTTNADFALARFNTDGTVDTTFGDLGSLEIDFFGFTDIAESVAIQPDGRIVLGGLARDNVDGYGVARILP